MPAMDLSSQHSTRRDPLYLALVLCLLYFWLQWRIGDDSVYNDHRFCELVYCIYLCAEKKLHFVILSVY